MPDRIHNRFCRRRSGLGSGGKGDAVSLLVHSTLFRDCCLEFFPLTSGKHPAFSLPFRGGTAYIFVMEHRHLNHEDYTTAAIDDIIECGGRSDWVELRDVAVSDPVILQKILRVCTAHSEDPYAQRYHLWRYYAARRVA